MSAEPLTGLGLLPYGRLLDLLRPVVLIEDCNLKIVGGWAIRKIASVVKCVPHTVNIFFNFTSVIS